MMKLIELGGLLPDAAVKGVGVLHVAIGDLKRDLHRCVSFSMVCSGGITSVITLPGVEIDSHICLVHALAT